MKSQSGNLKWVKGKWNKVDGELVMCERGLHCSKTPYQAFSFVQGEILAQVECRGEHLVEDDKECWREQRVIKAYRWTKKDSVALAIYSAELCLKNYEKEYPDDKRPYKAIQAAKRWLRTGSKKGLATARSAESAAELAAWSAARSAAESAAWSAESASRSAARSAESAARSAAWSAAESAAWSAESAARSAESAAGSAARSAESAAWSAAESAAWSAARSAESAARSAAIHKIILFFNRQVKHLKEI